MGAELRFLLPPPQWVSVSARHTNHFLCLLRQANQQSRQSYATNVYFLFLHSTQKNTSTLVLCIMSSFRSEEAIIKAGTLGHAYLQKAHWVMSPLTGYTTPVAGKGTQWWCLIVGKIPVWFPVEFKLCSLSQTRHCHCRKEKVTATTLRFSHKWWMKLCFTIHSADFTLNLFV